MESVKSEGVDQVGDLASRTDYWLAYEATYPAVIEQSVPSIGAHRALAEREATDDARELNALRANSLEVTRAALVGDGWDAYMDVLSRQGALYAKLGIEFGAWKALARIHQSIVVPHMVRTLGGDPERLSRAIVAEQNFVSMGLSVIARAYFVAQQHALDEQRAIAAARAAEAERAATTLRAVLDSIPDGVIVLDDRGEYALVNRVAREITRLDVGQSASTIDFGVYYADDDRPVPLEELPTMRAQRGEEFRDLDLRIWYPHADGPRVISCRGGQISGAAFRGGIVTFQDVTDRRRYEATMRRARELEEENRRVQAANRMKSEFLANMSHELRTPLNAIIGFTELLNDGVVDSNSAEYPSFLADILASARHLLQLINDILDLSKVEAGRMDFRAEDVDLGRLVTDVLAVLRGQSAEQRLTMRTVFDPSVTEAFLDPARFKQVLYNFVSNAIKFTPPGGTVTVRLCAAEDPSKLRLEVVDTGVGISANDLSRLFVAFEQLEEGSAKRHGGTGLGLALTRKLVEAQSGTTGASSVEGEGSTFWAELPRRAEDAGSLHDVLASTPSLHAGSARILVVEDDPVSQDILLRTLVQAGYSVEIAASGKSALHRIETEHFDAVTLDLLLPDITGFELLQRIRGAARSAKLPVIVVSVMSDDERVRGLAVDDVVGKPIDANALLAALSRLGVVPERGQVLVVDDDPSSLRLMNATLTQIGYRAVCESDARRALEWTTRETPAAVVLDLLMPEVDGFEFLERFRANPANRGVPVVVWSVKDLTTEERQRLRMRAHAILHKGRGDSLLENIRSLLSKATRE